MLEDSSFEVICEGTFQAVVKWGNGDVVIFSWQCCPLPSLQCYRLDYASHATQTSSSFHGGKHELVPGGAESNQQKHAAGTSEGSAVRRPSATHGITTELGVVGHLSLDLLSIMLLTKQSFFVSCASLIHISVCQISG